MTIDYTSKGDIPHTSYYDSVYMAKALDSALDMEFEGFDDGKLYWDMFLKLDRTQQSPTDPTIVLDVGAGSGRIFRKMALKAAKSGEDLSDVRFIGLDKSSSMVERAKSRASELSDVGSVTWIVGDASDMLAQPDLSQLRGQLSFVLCADGGIGYIEGEANIHAFFYHIAKLLRPGSGRACISLLEFQVAGAYKDGVVPSTYDESTESMDEYSKGSSLSFKPIFHREYVEDGHHVGRLDTEISKVDKEGNKTILEICHYTHRFRIWSIEDMIQTAEKAGLKHVETIDWQRMQHFVFMVPEAN
ncbi:hypothetical protein TRV_01540 [Trichophyton verrucosum HKI 0517]|uniref:Methyltransferase domain-containing protein n=1 Tax=Trichophyton verrucosum (strain HKI 0517) TaxID=663202 RepID=D4D381_TRIVH|nr:uncharacterized protein TRV_01540 [Trichophyton verrucosum HKI 0517]EFE43680.1 hypothetical protein TRV_01540 [Trichophyton verrucosum HKI 0517]